MTIKNASKYFHMSLTKLAILAILAFLALLKISEEIDQKRFK